MKADCDVVLVYASVVDDYYVIDTIGFCVVFIVMYSEIIYQYN